MTKTSWEQPATVQSAICWARASLDRAFPSTQRATSFAPRGILSKIRLASFSRAASTWAGEGASGRRSSGSSVTCQALFVFRAGGGKMLFLQLPHAEDLDGEHGGPS